MHHLLLLLLLLPKQHPLPLAQSKEHRESTRVMRLK